MKKKPASRKSAAPKKTVAQDVSSARAIASQMIGEVTARKRTLDEAAKSVAPLLAALEPRDRAFAHLLALTTLRHLGQIDAVLKQFIERPLPPAAVETKSALRIGVAQNLFLGTAAHASVDGSVALLASDSHHRGLVNAVLRRITTMDRDAVPGTETGINVPAWLLARWQATYGDTLAAAITRAHLIEPPLDISVKSDATGWAEKLQAELLPTGSLRLMDVGMIEDLPGFAEGEWWVQDAAAALPVALLGDMRDQTIIDLCAAPGGKTAQIAAGGARVMALDRSKVRVERLRGNLARLHLAADVIIGNAETWRPDHVADAVLLDAPCSATGTIRRHPDLPYLRTEQEIAKLAGVQARLLAAAATMVKPGGLLVYAVCSLEAEEGPQQVEAFLASHAEFRRVPIAAGECGINADWLTAAGDLRTLPCHMQEKGGMDGFFTARLRREA